MNLRNILQTHIESTQGWQTKGSLYDVGEQEGYSPEYVGRELRLMAEEGIIDVSYYKSKRNIDLARYARRGELKPLPSKPKIEIVERDGKFIALQV